MAESATMRILDASLNRAGEGLRVVEDFVRFVLDDPFLTGELKSLRHNLAKSSATIAPGDRHAARETEADVGTSISNETELHRDDCWSVCAASLKRAEQSLRSLEEYGKLVDAKFAAAMESLRYRLYTLEKAIDIGRTSREQLHGVRLCVLVDGRGSTDEFEAIVRQLVEAGVGMIQLRDKRLDDRELVERARLLVSLTRSSDLTRCQPPALPGVSTRNGCDTSKLTAEPGDDGRDDGHLVRKTLAVINDRADIAAAVLADGVHLGQEDLSVRDARLVIGPHMLVGVSTHNIDQARTAVLEGANFLGAGPTFASQTKSFDEFAGLSYLREVAAEIRLPTFAIGGISRENIEDVLTAGISRAAVGAAVTQAQDPGSAASELLAMLNRSVGMPAEAGTP
jgi:thiamine-phosphate pyrophosphorylase